MRPPVPSTIRHDAPALHESRWISLWKRLGTLRAQLRERESVSREIQAGFDREILPREHRLTDAVLGLSEALVERYRGNTLAPSDASLLGLWINENLERLSDHPFVDLDRLRRLRQRWRETLAPDADATPRMLDSTRAQLRRLMESSEPAASPACEEAGRKEAPDQRADREAPPAGRRLDDGDIHAMLLGTGDAARGADAVQQLTERLFRRLAQALHPDREPDEAQRKRKQILMGQALEARTARDLDTLLALHVEHLGKELPGVDAGTLVAALERQLEGMRRALTRSRFTADPLRRHIVERYDATLASARARLFERHAALLEQEIERTLTILRSVQAADGLTEALARRREREQDRLAIDELTGLGG